MLKLVQRRLPNIFLRHMSIMHGQKIEVNGVNVHYEKVGSGEHAVLLMPGVVGSTRTDFEPQIEKLNRKRLTVVAWDPPGQGFSRPPDRTLTLGMLKEDADFATELMRILGFPKYSIVGWSNGGISAILMAANNPENVRKIVPIAARAYVTKEEAQGVEKFKDVGLWGQAKRKQMIAVYQDEAIFQQMWAGWLDTYTEIFHKHGGNICKESLSKVKCPTLLVHGAKDAAFGVHHVKYLHEHIQGSKMKIFEKAAHGPHLQFPDEFNVMLERFLLEETTSKY